MCQVDLTHKGFEDYVTAVCWTRKDCLLLLVL